MEGGREASTYKQAIFVIRDAFPVEVLHDHTAPGHLGMCFRMSRTYAVRQSAYWDAFLTLTYDLPMPTGSPGISLSFGSNSTVFTGMAEDRVEFLSSLMIPRVVYALYNFAQGHCSQLSPSFCRS